MTHARNARWGHRQHPHPWTGPAVASGHGPDLARRPRRGRRRRPRPSCAPPGRSTTPRAPSLCEGWTRGARADPRRPQRRRAGRPRALRGRRHRRDDVRQPAGPRRRHRGRGGPTGSPSSSPTSRRTAAALAEQLPRLRARARRAAPRAHPGAVPRQGEEHPVHAAARAGLPPRRPRWPASASPTSTPSCSGSSSTRRSVGSAPSTRRPTSPCAPPTATSGRSAPARHPSSGDRGALLGWLGRGLTDGRDRRPPPRNSPKDGDDDDLHRARDPRRPDRHPRARPRDDPQDVGLARCTTTCYLVTCTATGEQLLIDAADDPHRCLLLVREGTGRLDHLVTTHQHWDHVRALEEVARATGATTYAGADDADALPARARTCGCRHGDVVTGRRARARRHPPARPHARVGGAVVGATPTAAPHLFTGDSLFPGGVGNTKNPGQSFDSLYADVVERVFADPRRRHLVLPRPRRRLDARRRAPAPRGVARARLVTAALTAPVRTGRSRSRSRPYGSPSARTRRTPSGSPAGRPCGRRPARRRRRRAP